MSSFVSCGKKRFGAQSSVATMTPPAVRTDTVLIKHLNTTIGAKTVQVYNRLPFFLMPEESDETLRHEGDLIEAAPDVLLLPFNDFRPPQKDYLILRRITMLARSYRSYRPQ